MLRAWQQGNGDREGHPCIVLLSPLSMLRYPGLGWEVVVQKVLYISFPEQLMRLLINLWQQSWSWPRGPLGHGQVPNCSHHSSRLVLPVCQFLFATWVVFSRRKRPGAPWELSTAGDSPLLKLYREGSSPRPPYCPCPSANTHWTCTMNRGHWLPSLPWASHTHLLRPFRTPVGSGVSSSNILLQVS